MNVNLHIERLVLDGVHVAPEHRSGLQAAIESELARLVAQGGLASHLKGGGATPRIAGGAVSLAAGQRPSDLGRQIAAAVYGGIGS
jgi:hypothetical protein